MSITAGNKTYTELELMERIWDREKIMDIMNRRVYYTMQGKRREELEEFWVRKPENQTTASFGKNYGWYVGMEEITRYYVTEFENHRRQILAGYAEGDPSISVKDANRLIGYSFVSPMATSLIEIAGDGNTAQGMWYSISEETNAETGNQGTATWRGEKIAVDFLREDGEWKIWHMVIAADFVNPAGENHSDMPLYYAPGKDPVEAEFGSPTVPFLAHDRTLHWADNYPPFPKAYETYEESMSYGPGGWRSEIIKPSKIMKLEVPENA